MSETLTDIWDRLRRRIPQPNPTRVVTAAALVVALTAAGCGSARADLPSRVCGTVAEVPIRVQDSVCRGGHADDRGTVVDGGQRGPVRWYVADARCLDADDATGLGESLDDDYLGEPCDKTRARKSTVTTTPRTADRKPAKTAAPRAARTPSKSS